MKKKTFLKKVGKTLDRYELCRKHDEDNCSICKGFYDNWAYNYEEIYKRYVAHLRHLYVYDYCREGIKETYKNFVRRCQYNGLFEKNSQTYLWKISTDNKKGFLIFLRFD